ncbi:MAG: ATP-binding protein, partial [Chloroflexi bacterium]
HSPFIAGPPITHPAQFFGRQRELRRIFNLFRQIPLQNAAILGPRRSGKTSFLYYLKQITQTNQNELRPDQLAHHTALPPNLNWVLVDFQDPRLGTQQGLLRYLLEQLSLPVPEPCDLPAFLDVMTDHPLSPTIILLDEIGVALARYPELDDAFWESLRSLATTMLQGRLGFVLTSPQPPEQLAQHSGMGSPFFNIFGYSAVLGPFTEDEARQLIASSPIPFPEEDIAWILAESGRWPFLVQILCRERLLALAEGETGPEWREEARQQIARFRDNFQ